MKKICFVTTIPITVKAFFLPVIRYLRQHTDWQIAVICGNDPELEGLLPEGVRFFPVAMKRGVDAAGVAACLKMWKIFREEGFDMVQYATPNAAVYASIAARLAGVKLRLYHQMGLRYLGFSGVKRAAFKALEKLTCRLSTHIECVSPSNRTLGLEEGLFLEAKAKVLFYGSTSGVDMVRFSLEQKPLWSRQVREELGLPADACVFGFAGRITGDKGINELLEAFLHMDSTRARLLLVGTVEDGGTLDPALMAQAGEDSRVVFRGQVTDIQRYFAAMDVLVLPSYREGFGNIVIEAGAMGVPVIVTDIPGPIDAMIRDMTGLVVPVKDPEALRQAMESLLGNDEDRLLMGQAGYGFVKERFDQQTLLQKILEDRSALLDL